MAPVAADGHDDQGFGATEVFVGTERAARRVGLQELVLLHLDLFDLALVGDLLDEARVQGRKLLANNFDDAIELVVGRHYG